MSDKRKDKVNQSAATSPPQAESTINGKSWTWPVATWVAIAAAIIAACSAGISLYGMYSTGLHNRLSVKPLLVIDFAYNDEGAGFVMTNDGLGPAVIGSFVVAVDDKPQMSWHAMEAALGLKPVSKAWRVPYPTTIQRVDLAKPALYWVMKGPESDLLIKQSNRVSISVCYCSIHNECWVRTRAAERPKEMASCEESKDQLVNIQQD